jgi:quercetin dioxygenase-like cupin family protein
VRATPVPEALVHSARLVDLAHLERIEVLGPTIQFVTDPVDEGAPCVMRGTIPPGVSVPLHSHADPETLLSLSGELRGLTFRGEDFEWIEIRPGDVFHVPGGAKHAFRNEGTEEVVMMITSTTKIGRFFRELGAPIAPGSPPSGPPPADRVQRFLETSARYGYWNASPQENARIGIVLPF